MRRTRTNLPFAMANHMSDKNSKKVDWRLACEQLLRPCSTQVYIKTSGDKTNTIETGCQSLVGLLSQLHLFQTDLRQFHLRSFFGRPAPPPPNRTKASKAREQ